MQSYTKNDHSRFPEEFNNSYLRYGKTSDIEKIQALHEPFAKRGILLVKDRKKIEADLPRTLVYCVNDEIIGVANLFKYDVNLFEVRGLAIHEKFQKSGIGKLIIEKLLLDLKKEFRNQEITVFALTVVPDFFVKMGWNIVKKEKFPRKIFDDCSFCVKKDECPEEAVEIIINGHE